MDFDFNDPYLRVFPQPRPLLDHEDVPFFGGLPDLLRSAREYTKREIVFVRAGGTPPGDDIFTVPVRISESQTVGHLLLAPKKNRRRTAADEKAERFLRSLAELLGDAYRWQYAWRAHEESAAANVPLPVIGRSEEKFAQSLREQLKAATQLLDTAAASLYLLDETTRTLKLRSCWGLPEERLLDPPRPLARAMADLEAMLGHAVVLNDEFALESWESPENFPTAVCIPVASNAAIFGTVWFFAADVRDFDAREMGYFEMAAGRLAAELERRAIANELNRRNAQKSAG